jgi:hypothetical protein
MTNSPTIEDKTCPNCSATLEPCVEHEFGRGEEIGKILRTSVSHYVCPMCNQLLRMVRDSIADNIARAIATIREGGRHSAYLAGKEMARAEEERSRIWKYPAAFKRAVTLMIAADTAITEVLVSSDIADPDHVDLAIAIATIERAARSTKNDPKQAALLRAAGHIRRISPPAPDRRSVREWRGEYSAHE